MTIFNDVGDGNFEPRVLQSNVPVLVDFGAEWCHPCRQLDPIIEELAEGWGDRVAVAKLDVDQNAETTMRCGVMGVPTLILFINGKPVETLTGFQPKKRLIERLAPHLPG
jgi:thioredoxin 1